MRRSFLAVLAVGLLTGSAHAVITVSSSVTLGEGVRAQAIITNPTGFTEGGTGLTAIAVKEINASIIIRDLGFPIDQGGTGLLVTKRVLTPFQTYGQGDPRGWPVPPTTDPTPPWHGLVWPYRDQYDYFPNQFDPLGNDVGTPFFDEPDVYGFVDVDGISRGGPTDPVGFPDGGGPSSADWLLRGITGNGLTGPATYFNFDIFDGGGGPLNRDVRLTIFAAQAIVVVQDELGNYSELLVPIPDFTLVFPEPTSLLGAVALLGLAGMRRRR